MRSVTKQYPISLVYFLDFIKLATENFRYLSWKINAYLRRFDKNEKTNILTY